MNVPDFRIPNRHSLRMRDYDYAQAGAYFVTICTQDRSCLLGEGRNGEIILNDAGRMVTEVWFQIPGHYPGIDFDGFVAMPNHIHGIVLINLGQPQGVAPTGLSLPGVVHRFKTLTTKRYADGVRASGWRPFPGRLWQRNYYEHVVRNDDELNEIRQYISFNPERWPLDEENPGVLGQTA